MIKNLRNFPIFLKKELEKPKILLPSKYKKIQNIVVAGMGGSAIAAEVLKEVIPLKIPLEISKGYFLPYWTSKDTLLICVSYSGNTKETLTQFHQGIKKKSSIIVITSDGKLMKEAKKKAIPFIELPKGFLPRESFPFIFSSLIRIFKTLGLTKEVFSFDLLEREITKIEKEAKLVARKIKNSFPIISSQYFSVSTRWEDQLSENAKHLAESKTLPELAHNEIESWRKLDKNYSLILLRDCKETKEIKCLFEGIKKIIKKAPILEIKAKGKTKPERVLYLILFGDFVSYFLAKEKKINPKTTDYIKKLKKVI